MPVFNDGVPVAAPPAATARYAEPIDLVHRYDIRIIGEIASDDDQVITRTTILTHPNVIVSLDSGSGRVETALNHGNRYTAIQLATLTNNSLAHLKDIVCAIAMAKLLRRRPGCYTDLLAQVAHDAEDYLKQISSGYDVFSIDEHISAGEISDEGNRNMENVSLMNIRNLMSDNLIARLYPHRGDTGRRRRNFG